MSDFLKQLNKAATQKPDIYIMIDNEIGECVDQIHRKIINRACSDIKNEIIQKAKAGNYSTNKNTLLKDLIFKKSKNENTEDNSSIVVGEYDIGNCHRLHTEFSDLKGLSKEHTKMFRECLLKYTGISVERDQYDGSYPYWVECELISTIEEPAFLLFGKCNKCYLNDNANKVIQSIQEELASDKIEISFAHISCGGRNGTYKINNGGTKADHYDHASIVLKYSVKF